MHEILPDNWPTKPLYAPEPTLFTPSHDILDGLQDDLQDRPRIAE